MDELSRMLMQHPGFLAYDNGRIEVLHADWPTYPTGHGWTLALQSIAVFPASVRFRVIDEIDECVLFIASAKGPCLEPQGDLFSPKWFHVAIWRDDLVELCTRGFVGGIAFISEYEAALAYYRSAKEQFPQLPEPRPEQFSDDEAERVMRISGDGIFLTPEGSQALLTLASSTSNLDENMMQRVGPILSIGLYDTAVREGAVILETRLREVVNNEAFGIALVESYYTYLCRRSGREIAVFKILRNELRTIFKFVRNDFVHCLQQISHAQSLVLLNRISKALVMVNDIEAADSPRNVEHT